MLLEILISFGIVVILGCIALVLFLLLFKTVSIIERYLDKKRNDLGEEKYSYLAFFIKTTTILIVGVIFLTWMVYTTIFL